MYEDSYLVPANAKKGTLIFNIFRPIDLGLFIGGAVTTLILLFIFADYGMVALILSVLPIGITSLLVLPIPHYHNTLCAIQCIIEFYTKSRQYEWKGWCFYEQFINDEKSKK